MYKSFCRKSHFAPPPPRVMNRNRRPEYRYISKCAVGIGLLITRRSQRLNEELSMSFSILVQHRCEQSYEVIRTWILWDIFQRGIEITLKSISLKSLRAYFIIICYLPFIHFLHTGLERWILGMGSKELFWRHKVRDSRSDNLEARYPTIWKVRMPLIFVLLWKHILYSN